MTLPCRFNVLVLLPIMLFGCVSQGGISPQDAVVADKIEMQVDAGGGITEVEYHIPPDQVPSAVRAAMKARYPGAPIVGAEKERHSGNLYYELAARVDGRKVEVMFSPDGVLHEIEAEVEASTVPAPVREAIQKAHPRGRVTSWEVIRDADNRVLAYHTKLSENHRNLKVILTTDGVVSGTFREMPGEIEVPIE